MNTERKGIKKQLKVELEGVHGSPDGLSVKDNTLEEYKCTWRSMKRWDEDPEGTSSTGSCRAFTGALKRKEGKFEYASGGTIFLDEIGEMSFALQSKLLQVLQDREFARLGGNEMVRVDVRVVCATNRDLRKAVDARQFREDLYYRLNVVNIRVPALRERREDIPLVTRYFLHKYSEKYGRARVEVSDQLMAYFLSYDWPCNVRGLENLVKRLVILEDERFIFSEFRSRNVSPAAPAPMLPADAGAHLEDFDLSAGPISLKQIARRASGLGPGGPPDSSLAVCRYGHWLVGTRGFQSTSASP